jgi:LmbE family N-acetylglucosaminyl deacetylase
VFFGDRYVNHRDHRITGWATLDAVSPAAANPHYFPEQIAEGLTAHQVRALYCSGTLAPDVWIDVADHIETKFDALFQHSSQLVDVSDEFRAFLRDRAVHDGRTAGLEYAEGFRRIQFGD